MTTARDILQFLEDLAPRQLKMEWDNTGLLCGSPDTPVEKVLVALDPFDHVCQEAADFGAQLLLTHHPLIFRPISSVTDQTDIGRSIEILCRHGITAINAHTNLDCANGGVNDTLAEVLGLDSIQTIPLAGENHGLLRWGEICSQSLADFIAHVKDALGCPAVRYVSVGKPVHRVAVGGGSCADSMPDALACGCDTFVTADVKYNQFWDARKLGLNLIDAGHFYTENPIVPVLAEKISAVFPELTVKISQNHRDCMKFG